MSNKKNVGQQGLFDHKEYTVKKSNPRQLPLDFIFTLDNITDASMLVAWNAGWKVGIRSSAASLDSDVRKKVVDYIERWQWRFQITFIDNEYTNYNHKHHLEVVKRFTPKYCTVMDVMTEKQCAKDNIKYHSLKQILEWAEELSQHAQNVIVIPKYDCLDKIPEKFMLGYSIPTSHGGTPLPLSRFKGRRVHLLGGSWKNQLAALEELGDSVVSIDNNYIHKVAQYAQFTFANGEMGSLSDIKQVHMNAVNPFYICFTISLGNIAAKVNELYKERKDS